MKRPSIDDPRLAAGVKVTDLGKYPVRSMADAHVARRAVRMSALHIGFMRIEGEELTIVASELCTNVVKYGVRGELRTQQILHPLYGAGIVLEAHDIGPAFHSFEVAVRDRSDDRGTIPPEAILRRSGIGAGLGAVKRWTHLLWMQAHAVGKSVTAVRFVKRPDGLWTG